MEGKSIHGQKTWHLGDFTRGQTLKQKPSTPRGKKSVKRGVLHSGGVKGHHRAKLCRAKFSSGETIRRAKFSSLNEKFVTFARQSFAR